MNIYEMSVEDLLNILVDNSKSLDDTMKKSHSVELTTAELMDLSISVGAYLLKEVYNEDGTGEEAIPNMLKLKHKLDAVIEAELKQFGIEI